MLFNSFSFLVFFPLLHVFYWYIQGNKKYNLLLIASILFYGYWSLPFLIHFLIIIFVNYWIYANYFSTYNKKIITVLVILNLLNLGFFKYSKFLSIFISDFLSFLGFNSNFSAYTGFFSEMVLPLAISFYSFQIIAFHLDEYRNEFKEKISFRDFFLFIIFFPQLIAGPIMRFREFITQIRKKKYLNEKGVDVAFFFLLVGLVKKVIIADGIANAIDPVFEHPEIYNWKSLVIGVYGFSIQIYCDFAGYSDMARGLALALGFKIPANFKAPYFSISFSDFWSRWHITLSRWLKDYLYIPLGGNRISKTRTFFNIFLTMFIGGVWHGANYTFIVWGILHSVYLILERLFFYKTEIEFSHLKKILRSLLIFHLVSFSWIFFRSNSVESSWILIKGIFLNSGKLALDMTNLPVLFILFFLLHYLEYFPKSFTFFRRHSGFVLPLLGFVIAVVIVTKSSVAQSFLYFQF